jgi:hypothetical protein
MDIPEGAGGQRGQAIAIKSWPYKGGLSGGGFAGDLVYQEEDRHADGQAIRDLAEHDAVAAVGDLAFHFEATIDTEQSL